MRFCTTRMEKKLLQKKMKTRNITERYFNCHTDVTIPYDELGDIIVFTKTGETVTLIENGRFVLPGTERLNEVLD